MKTVYEMTKLERERAKLREIQQQLRALHMQIFMGGGSPEQAKEYSQLRLAMDVSIATIATYEGEKSNA
jgi:hypothetical protein